MAYCVEITRKRKHFPCCYQSIETGIMEVWESIIGNAMRTQTVRWVSPQLFRVLFQLLNSWNVGHTVPILCVHGCPAVSHVKQCPVGGQQKNMDGAKENWGSPYCSCKLLELWILPWIKKKQKTLEYVESRQYLLSSWGCIKGN